VAVEVGIEPTFNALTVRPITSLALHTSFVFMGVYFRFSTHIAVVFAGVLRTVCLAASHAAFEGKVVRLTAGARIVLPHRMMISAYIFFV
jgi:hypothetical protein